MSIYDLILFFALHLPPTSQYLSCILFQLETKIDPDDERLSFETGDDYNDIPYETVKPNISISPRRPRQK